MSRITSISRTRRLLKLLIIIFNFFGVIFDGLDILS